MFSCLHFVGPCKRHIDHIDRRHCKLLQVPDDVVRNFRTLEECRLDANQIKELPKDFFRLKRIRRLTLGDNDLMRLPGEISCFSNLVELDISRNDISEIPTSIRFCESLQILDASNNPLQSLPTGFCQLRNLRILSVNDISISELPEDIGDLQSLEKLELRDNCLKTVPASFASLTNLEFLDLGANEFHDLPQVIGHLLNLNELWLDDNEIRSLPIEIGNLVKLQLMDVSENLLYKLPESISGLVSLDDLNLSQNSLTCLPDGIGELKKLIVLKVNRNRLLSLTSSIGNCSALQELYLAENVLSALPSAIGNLECMIHLNVDQNQLTELPVDVGRCTALNILSLRENCLNKLPADIGNCSHLRVLDVSGNRIERLPLTLTKCPLTALWLSLNQSQPVATLQRDVDPVTKEGYLTCYLLPQDQLETHCETDPTMTESELVSFSASLQPLSPRQQQQQFICDETASMIITEFNDTYEPAVSTDPTNTHNDVTEVRQSQLQQPELLVQSSSPTAVDSKAPEYHSRLLKNLDDNQLKDSTPTSPEHNLRRSTHSTNTEDSSMGTILGSTRVHFSGSVKSDDYHDKSGIVKGFPKTQHPRVVRKSVNINDHSAISGGKLQSTSDQNASDENNSPPSSLDGHLKSEINDDNLSDQHSLQTNKPGFYRPQSQMSTKFAITSDAPNSSNSSQRNITMETVTPKTKPRIRNVNYLTDPVTPDKMHDQFDLKSTNSDYSNKAYISTVIDPNLVNGNSDVITCTTNCLRPASTFQSSTSKQPQSDNLNTTYNEEAVKDVPDEDETYSSGGEEIYVISRRVGFKDDVEDNEEKSNQKLIRRDTPHYTKRARIQSKTADGVDSEEAVLKILEKYQASVLPNHLTTSEVCTNQTNVTMKNANAVLGSSYNPGGTIYDRMMNPTNNKQLCPQEQQFEIHIHRPIGVGLGLSIAGGVSSIPFRGTDHGIFVSRLTATGLAASSGLKLGDKILEVNGIDLVNAEHEVAVSALRANTNYFRIIVSRLGSPQKNSIMDQSYHLINNTGTHHSQTSTNDHCQEQQQVNNTISVPVSCTIQRDHTGFGFSIAGGRGMLPPSHDYGEIFVSKLTDGGAAQKHGKLRVGDRIIKINGMDVTGARHDQVLTLLAGSEQFIDLELIRHAQPPQSTGQMSIRTHRTSNGSVKASNDAVEDVCTSTACTISPQSIQPCSRTYLRHENGMAVEKVIIRNNNGGPLGLAICGGYDNNCSPFGASEPGIFISKISTDGVAHGAGLRVGDRVLKVNGIDLRCATHDDAVQALIRPVKELQLEVRLDPRPPGLRQISISKHPREKYGLYITGGLDSAADTNSDKFGDSELSALLANDDGIFVTRITPEGPIGRDNRLKPGDRLLEINGHWMMGLTMGEAIKIFQEADTNLSLVVCNGPLELYGYIAQNYYSEKPVMPPSIVHSSTRIRDISVDQSNLLWSQDSNFMKNINEIPEQVNTNNISTDNHTITTNRKSKSAKDNKIPPVLANPLSTMQHSSPNPPR